MVERVRAVAGRVLAAMDEIATRFEPAYRTVPAYQALSDEVFRTEVVPVSRDIVEEFFTSVVAGRAPDASRVEAIPRMAQRRMDMGVPLEPMLHVYRIAGTTMWDAIVDATRADETSALGELGRSWFDYMDRASSLAADAYLRASHEQLRRLDARRDALLDAILSAEDPSEIAAVASSFSIALASAYLPIVVRGDEVPSLIDRLGSAAADGAISGVRGGTIVLLIPEERRSGVAERLVRAAAGAVVALGDAAAPGATLVRALRRTEQLAEIAARVGRTGLVTSGELMLEQLLAQAPEIARTLSLEVLEPLERSDRDGVLAPTARGFLAAGSVERVAEQLGVHPNTVRYRLRRVHELTGLDPTVPDEAAILALALRTTL